MKIDLEMDTKLKMETELKVMIKQNMKIQLVMEMKLKMRNDKPKILNALLAYLFLTGTL